LSDGEREIAFGVKWDVLHAFAGAMPVTRAMS